MRACILIRTDTGSSDDIVKYVRKLEGVKATYPCFGRADIVVRAEVRTNEALATLLGEVNSAEGIVATETLPEIEVV